MNAVEGDVLKGHLEMLVLAAVQTGASHGYAIIEALRNLSDGLLDLPEGTIYPVLHRLESRGLLESRWEGAGRKRRVYRLTRDGRRFLGEQAVQWRDFARAVRAVLGAAL